MGPDDRDTSPASGRGPGSEPPPEEPPSAEPPPAAFEPPPVNPFESPEPRRPNRPRRKPPPGPTRGQIQRRRLIAAGLAVLLAGAAAVLLFGGGEKKAPPVPVPEDAAQAAKGLSTAEKIDTVIATGFAGTAAPQIAPTQGGVVIEPANWPGAGAGPALLSSLHGAGKAAGSVPPLVIGLQEGGEYRAYADLPPPVRQLDIGDGADPAAAEASSAQTARALKKAGFDLNLAPVADIATLDSPIADRAYGDSPEVVSVMTAAAIKGCVSAGLLCAPTHFPGEGAANADTGNGPATVGLDTATLRTRDLAPFEAAFQAGAPAVVISHAFYAAYDSVTPGSLTAPIVTGLLRDELHFKGAAITDDLSAGAIRGGDGAGDAGVLALGAGADLLLVSDPVDAQATKTALAKALMEGQLSQDRLDEAAGRVLALKKEAGIDIPM